MKVIYIEIIKESVNDIITELDWKTKMNYVKGRLRQGDEAYRKGDENGYIKYIKIINNILILYKKNNNI